MMTANFVDSLLSLIEPHALIVVLILCAALTDRIFHCLCKPMNVFDARVLAIVLSALILIGAARILGYEVTQYITAPWFPGNGATHTASLYEGDSTQLDAPRALSGLQRRRELLV